MLHGHFGNGRTFERLADSLAPDWRVVAPDQRGHGRSDPAPDYDREGYVADAAHVIEALDLAPAVVLGHSLGGVNAYQLAAHRPELVRAVIVEDAPAQLPERPDFEAWPALPQRSVAPETALADMNRSRRLLAGDHWADWLAGEHPRAAAARARERHASDRAGARDGESAPEHAPDRVPGRRAHDPRRRPRGLALAVASFLEELG